MGLFILMRCRWLLMVLLLLLDEWKTKFTDTHAHTTHTHTVKHTYTSLFKLIPRIFVGRRCWQSKVKWLLFKRHTEKYSKVSKISNWRVRCAHTKYKPPDRPTTASNLINLLWQSDWDGVGSDPLIMPLMREFIWKLKNYINRSFVRLLNGEPYMRSVYHVHVQFRSVS